jgi:hypothetical protein
MNDGSDGMLLDRNCTGWALSKGNHDHRISTGCKRGEEVVISSVQQCIVKTESMKMIKLFGKIRCG